MSLHVFTSEAVSEGHPDKVADQAGAKRADVEKMRADKMLEHLPAGAWYQDAAGAWKQK